MSLDIATLIAAVLAFISSIASIIVGLWQVKRTGDQKIAEYRRIWIEDLRRALAEYNALLFAKSMNQLDDEKQNKLFQLAFYIKMMLNPNEDNEPQIPLEAEVMEALGSDKIEGDEIEKIIELARKVFKQNWEKAKQES